MVVLLDITYLLIVVIIRSHFMTHVVIVFITGSKGKIVTNVELADARAN